MTYGLGDLNSFVQHIAAMAGVEGVYLQVEDNGGRASVFVLVEGGLSSKGYELRRSVIREFETHMIEQSVSEHMGLFYRVMAVGSELSPPHVPASAIPVRPAVLA